MAMRKRDLDVFRKILEDRHTTLYRFTHAIQGPIHGAIETQSAVESPEETGR